MNYFPKAYAASKEMCGSAPTDALSSVDNQPIAQYGELALVQEDPVKTLFDNHPQGTIINRKFPMRGEDGPIN